MINVMMMLCFRCLNIHCVIVLARMLVNHASICDSDECEKKLHEKKFIRYLIVQLSFTSTTYCNFHHL